MGLPGTNLHAHCAAFASGVRAFEELHPSVRHFIVLTAMQAAHQPADWHTSLLEALPRNMNYRGFFVLMQ